MKSSRKNLVILGALLFWFLLVCSLSYWSLAGEDHTRPVPSKNNLSTINHIGELQDLDQDGLPDSVELRTLNSRENFRQWFTYIAEKQYNKLSDSWQTDQRDCAGLVRFAWREALRKHDHAWYQRMGPEYEAIAGDLPYALSGTPLQEKLFRTNFGVFGPADLNNGTFSEFADAQTLKNYNTNFVSRSRDEAKPGDLFVFHQPWVQKFPYHIMIFLGSPHEVTEAGHDWVVYHTGPTQNDPGLVKKVRLSTLDHHPDRRWRPVPGNPNFIGIYRLKILDQRVFQD